MILLNHYLYLTCYRCEIYIWRLLPIVYHPVKGQYQAQYTLVPNELLKDSLLQNVH